MLLSFRKKSVEPFIFRWENNLAGKDFMLSNSLRIRRGRSEKIYEIAGKCRLFIVTNIMIVMLECQRKGEQGKGEDEDSRYPGPVKMLDNLCVALINCIECCSNIETQKAVLSSQSLFLSPRGSLSARKLLVVIFSNFKDDFSDSYFRINWMKQNKKKMVDVKNSKLQIIH